MIHTPTARALKQERLQPRPALEHVVVPAALFLVGTASVSLYFWGRDLHRFTQWLAAYIGLFIGQLALYLLASYVVLRWSESSTRIARWAAIVMGVVFVAASRVVLVPQRPYLSSDVYRYVWDGQVQAAGINPYRYVPAADELLSLRDQKIYPNINPEDKLWRSPYPPVAQAVFLVIARIAPMNVTAFKAVMSLFDIFTVVLLMLLLARSGIDPVRAIIFAWHPLLVFESAHSGHVESVYLTFVALALLVWSGHKPALSGIPMALATLVKFYPALLLPAFLGGRADAENAPMTSASKGWAHLLGRVFQKRNFAMIAAFSGTVVLSYAPYLSAGSNPFWFLGSYIQQEGFVQSGERYFLLAALRNIIWIPTNVFLILSGVCLISVAVWQLLRIKRDLVDAARGALTLAGTYLLLTTPRYAWYYVLLIPFLCVAANIGWLYLTCASVLLYLVWYTPLVYPGVPLWLGASVYIPTLALLSWERIRKSGAFVSAP